MKIQQALGRLMRLGYIPQVEGEKVRFILRAGACPDPAEVARLVEALRRHKAEVLALLQTQAPGVRGRDCEHAQVRRGFAFCQGPISWNGIPGQNPDQTHPCLSFTPRVDPVPEAEPIPSCNACPWCLDNPWTHYPDLPKWCGYWWNHLVADNPQCRNRREGRVPDPKAGDSRASSPNNDSMRSHTRDNPEESEGLPFTCFECVHFDPAHPSPNPTQAWGECRRLGKGRYGVARACDGFQKARQQDHPSTTAFSRGRCND